MFISDDGVDDSHVFEHVVARLLAAKRRGPNDSSFSPQRSTHGDDRLSWIISSFAKPLQNLRGDMGMEPLDVLFRVHRFSPQEDSSLALRRKEQRFC
jgi:hypothetical protein